MAGYGWLSTDPEWIGEIQLRIAPGAGEAYIWNCVTLEQFRRRGIFGLLLGGITDWAKRSGLRRLWVGSVAIPAEKAVRPAGFRPVLEFTSRGLTGLRWRTVRPSPEADPEDVAAALRMLEAREGSILHRSKQLRH